MLAAMSAASLPPPPCYRAPRTVQPITIDGDLDKPEWGAAPWSRMFGDIRGKSDAPSNSQPKASCTTRMKMLWDDDYLYVGAVLTSDFEVVAEFTARNSPIFQKDSDFEVFVDAASSCHNYKELEVNARNVVWNLVRSRSPFKLRIRICSQTPLIVLTLTLN